MRISNPLSLKLARRTQDTQKLISRALERLSNQLPEGRLERTQFENFSRRSAYLARAQLNIQYGFSLINTTMSSISQLLDLSQNLRELAVQAQGTLLSTAEREEINTKLTSLVSQFIQVQNQSRFGDLHLFQENKVIEILAGANPGENIEIELPLLNFSNTLGRLEISKETTQIGLGTFSSGATVGADAPRDVELYDLNGDGQLDLLWPGQFENDAVFALGNGDGTFQSPTCLNAGWAPENIEAADIDNDGDLD